MTKEKKIHWAELVDKADPTIRTRPIVTYVFNNGERIFHKAKRKNSGNRKG
jgi:hypothetical protein